MTSFNPSNYGISLDTQIVRKIVTQPNIDFGKSVFSSEPMQVNDFEAYYVSLKGRGFDFFIFDEEPEYAQAYTSHPVGVSARYHFIEMITQGGHSFNHPMTDAEVRIAHSDLDEKEIQNLRRIYKLNASFRPFKIPVQVSQRGLTDQDLATLNANLSLFENRVRQSSSLRRDSGLKPKFGSLQKVPTIRGTIIRRSSVNPPSNPSIGDLWFNTGTAKLFAFLSDGTSTYWVEV